MDLESFSVCFGVVAIGKPVVTDVMAKPCNEQCNHLKLIKLNCLVKTLHLKHKVKMLNQIRGMNVVVIRDILSVVLVQ